MLPVRYLTSFAAALDDSSAIMASQSMPPQMPQQMPALNIDRYVVIHVATTCDEHGVYVTKDSAEVIELGWILVDANSLEEVRRCALCSWHGVGDSFARNPRL